MTIPKELSERTEALEALAKVLDGSAPDIIYGETCARYAQAIRALLTATQGQEWRDLPVIRARAENLKEWLQDNAPYIAVDQRHLDADTVERAYWHYGYMVALRDVLASYDKGSTFPPPQAKGEG